eukprot:g20694.t1
MCGWVEKIVDSIEGHGLGFNIAMLRALRLVRIFRLMRLLKRVRPLRELHKLVMMMATCFRTLIWSFLLCFVVMTVWAMLLVEVVHPALQDMNESAKFVCNKQCLAAVSSVMHANLLLFKTVIAGDGWGEIAVPVIHEHPGTAFIFVGSLLTLVFGVLNLIVAVVVDTFADARLNDVQNLAEEMEDEIEHDRKALAKLFAKIDKDGSGQLTLSEMIEGARHDPTFQSRLRVMDIDEHDLEQLFQMIDHDQSGTIEVAEFIGPLSRWAHDSKTAPRFIKYNMIQTMHLQEDLYELSSECFNQLAARIDDLALQMQELKAPWSTETELQTDRSGRPPTAQETRRSLRRSVKGEETEKARPTEGLEEVFSDLGADSGSEDALLDHCRLRAKPLSVSPEHSSADKNSEDWPGTVDRKPKRRARGLHPEAFRHMYMERNGKRHATDEVGPVASRQGSLSVNRDGSGRRKTKKVEITGSFLRQSTEMMTNTSKAKLKSAMNSVYLANFMAVVVLVDAYCTVVDIDATAAREKSPEVFRWISDLCLVFYTVEVFAWLLIFGLEILRDWMMLLDLFIVLCGWGEKVIETLADGGLGFRIAVLRALRLVRIFRLMRLLKRIRPLRELHKLVMMMATCLRTLLWSFMLCFVVMTVWAMLMVEHPATAVIFVGSLLTLVFGVLNLIVAVVVDTFADARLNDVENLAQEMEDEIEHDRTALAKLFARIDKDGSGQLTLQELIEGARDDSGFQSRLRVMDIDEHDLEQLFQMIDVDQSGTIEVAEFIGPLSRWAHDSKTAPRFIKYNMIQTMHLQEDLYELSVDCFNQLASRIDDLSLQIRGVRGQTVPSGDPLFADLLNNTLELEAEPSDPPTEPHTSPMEPREPGDASPSEAPASSESEKPEAAQGTIELDSCNPSPSPSRQVSHGLPHERLDRMDRQISGAAHHRGVDQPRASPRDMEFLAPKSVEREARESSNAIEKMLESAMAKLESKLEQLLVEARKTPMDRHVLPSEDLTAFADAKLRQRRKKGKKMLHPEAFRSMYMNHGRRLSLVELPSAQRRQSSHDAFVSTVGADFVRAKESDLDETALGCLKKKATKLLNSVYLANFIVVVVFLDAYCTCRDIDSRAHQQPTPQAFRILSDLCLVLYTVELLLHFFLQGFSICRDWMIFLDLVIIVCGYIELFFSFLGDESGVIGISIVRALRLVRIFRLIRLLRKVRTLRELHKLATMMATCAKTLVWSFLLCFLVMTVWSMLMVEMIHPLLTDLELSSCRGQCESAMSSVMNANLLLFKTVIAGDSWGEIAVPVIEQYPATAVIFMGSLLTLVFGVLNLIVAVVVDTFAEFRLNDVQNLAEEGGG